MPYGFFLASLTFAAKKDKEIAFSMSGTISKLKTAIIYEISRKGGVNNGKRKSKVVQRPKGLWIY